MQTKGKFHCVFAIAAVYCLVIPAIYLFSNPSSIYMVPIVEDLHISRGTHLLRRATHEIISAVACFLYIKAQKRFGLRGPATMGLLCATLSTVYYAVVHSVPLLFLGDAFSALIWPLSGQVTAGSIVDNWFAKKSATVISIIFGCGNITGFFNAKIIIYWINHYGWGRSMLYTMAVMLVVAVIVYAVVRSHPGEKNLHAWGTPQGREQSDEIEEDSPSKLPDADFNTSMKNIRLYSAYAWHFITGITVYPVVGIFSAQLTDIDPDAATTGNAVGIMSISSLVLLIPLGRVIDGWGIRPATVACILSHLEAITLLLTVSLATPVLATVTGFFMGAAILLFAILPLFMKEVFGFRELAGFISYSVIFRTMGSAIGSSMLDSVCDYAGSYRIVLPVSAGILLLLLLFGCIAASKKSPLWVETCLRYPGYVEN